MRLAFIIVIHKRRLLVIGTFTRRAIVLKVLPDFIRAYRFLQLLLKLLVVGYRPIVIFEVDTHQRNLALRLTFVLLHNHGVLLLK